MLYPGCGVRIWLYTGATDMRKSFNGLSALVRHQLDKDPLNGHWYVFINRRKTLMKILYFESNGYAIWSKRLEQGQFITHRISDHQHAITVAELQCLIDGIDLRKSRKYKRFSDHRAAG
jgi:transposase